MYQIKWTYFFAVILSLTQARNLRKRQTNFDYLDYGSIFGQNNQFDPFGTQNGQTGNQGQFGNQAGQSQFGQQNGQFGQQGQLGQQNGQLFGQNIPSGVRPVPTTASTSTPRPTTPPPMQLRQCMANCKTVTSEWNPVCGSNGVRYGNPSALRCAQSCGASKFLFLITCFKHN